MDRNPEGLTAHPKNRDIYGKDVDQSFIERVDTHGISSPVKITSQSHFTDAEWTIIGGHRRVRAAEELGIPVEVAEVGPFDTRFDEIEALLLDNDHRNPTPVQEVNEVDEWREVYQNSPNLESDSAVEAACDHVTFERSTYYEARRIQKTAEENKWGLRDPIDISDDIADAARHEWRRLERGEAAIGGAYAEIESEVERFKKRQQSESDEEVGNQQNQQIVESGEYRFFPVFGDNEAHILKSRYEHTPGKVTSIQDLELNWWEENAIVPPHPFILVNPVRFPILDPARDDLDRILRFPEEMYVFADSGGYQLMKNQEARVVDAQDEHDFEDSKVYPESLLEWQYKHADAGATLDLPPYNITGGSTPDPVKVTEEWKELFDRRMERSVEYARRMSVRLGEVRDDDEFDFCPVLHGKPDVDSEDPHRLVRLWYVSMKNGIEVDPDVWVLKPEPAHDVGMLAFWLGFALEYLQDVDHVHALMVGGLEQKTLLMFYSMLTGQKVSSDTSTYSYGGRHRQFSLPFSRRNLTISNRSSSPLQRWPCRCQVCSTVEKEHGIEFITEGTSPAQSASMNLHNLNTSLFEDTVIWGLLEDHFEEVAQPDGSSTDTEFWRFMAQWLGQGGVIEFKRAVHYLYIAQSEGLEAANDQYEVPELSRTAWESELNEMGSWVEQREESIE